MGKKPVIFSGFGLLDPGVHVDFTLIRTIYQSTLANHAHPFMEVVYPEGCGLLQQDNAPCHKAKLFLLLFFVSLPWIFHASSWIVDQTHSSLPSFLTLLVESEGA